MNDIDEYIKNSDDALFHYTKTSIALEHILHIKKFRLSLLKYTNDPKEYQFKLFNGIWWSSDQDTVPQLLKEAQNVLNRILLLECKLMFFCTNNKPTLILNNDSSIVDEHVCLEGWNKSRMWSQYGQNHYGVCLVFSREELESFLKNSKIDFKASNVQYSQKGEIDSKVFILNGNRLKNEGVEKYSFNHVKDNSEEFFFRKNIDYRDEAEFRVVVFDSDKQHEYLDISSSLKCVIAGDRTHEVYIPLINQMCRDLGIESRRVRWYQGKSHLFPCKTT